MALDAGDLKFTLEFATGLKDSDLFGKQDPYATIKCGSQTVRSRTCKGGGTKPVWNETFTLQLVNENELYVELKDSDTMSDDQLGTATVRLAQVREHGSFRGEFPVISKKGKQQGAIFVDMKFTANKSIKKTDSGASQPPPGYYAPPQGYAQPYPGYAMPQYPGYPPQPGYAQPAGYQVAYPGYPQQAYAAAPQYAQPYPQQAYPQQAYPQQAYPQQAYPQQAYQQQAYAQQAYAAQYAAAAQQPSAQYPPGQYPAAQYPGQQYQAPH